MANEFQGYSNMMNMQERAAERVRRMQRIQDEAARRANEELSPKAAEQRQESKTVPTQPSAPAETQKSRRTPMPVDYLHGEKGGAKRTPAPPAPPSAPLIGADQDSAMLLALILLLSRETSDPSLMLALMYIMM
ncbi:MAG: hypothetical protein ACLU8W_07490 [Clostridia bacterium]